LKLAVDHDVGVHLHHEADHLAHDEESCGGFEVEADAGDGGAH